MLADRERSSGTQPSDPRLDIAASRVEAEEEASKDQSANLSKEQKDRWLAHIKAGHWPYRKDCQVCVRGSAVGLQHRKSKYKDSHVLSYDIAGPFSEVGRSFDATGYRYLLVAGYRVPTELLRPDANVAAPAPPPSQDDQLVGWCRILGRSSLAS